MKSFKKEKKKPYSKYKEWPNPWVTLNQDLAHTNLLVGNKRHTFTLFQVLRSLEDVLNQWLAHLCTWICLGADSSCGWDEDNAAWSFQRNGSKYYLIHVSPFCSHSAACGHPSLTNYILMHSCMIFNIIRKMAATKFKPDIVTGWLAPGTSKALHFANKSMCTHLGKGITLYFKRVDRL